MSSPTPAPNVHAALNTRRASSRERWSQPVKMGTNETVREPSPTRRRNRLGIMKAMKNVSVAAAAKLFARMTSRTRPRTRLARVAPPTTPAERATPERPSVDRELSSGYLAASSEEPMAHHASAKKRHRQSLRRRERNRHQLSGVRNAGAGSA
jgi:hypothetical protein